MKRERSTTGATTKKPTSSNAVSMTVGPAKGAAMSAPSSQSVTPAVYSRYIDSRMKQFGTR